jgi:hypothetical protein
MPLEYPLRIVHFMLHDRGINKSFRWAAIEDLRVHRIHLFVNQEEMNKESDSKIVYSSLAQ